MGILKNITEPNFFGGMEKNMAKIKRSEARDLLFTMLFETEFRSDDDPAKVFEIACENREIPDDKYIRQTFFGVMSRAELVDGVISKYSKGWRADRLSKVSRTIIRIATYEMLFDNEIPANVSISQAVELAVKYGEDRAKPFVNGVLSGLFKDIEEKGIDGVINGTLEEMRSADNSAEAEGESEQDGE